MLSGISNYLFGGGAADELCGPSEEAAGQPRLKTSTADDEWILVDKSSTYLHSCLCHIFVFNQVIVYIIIMHKFIKKCNGVRFF